MTIEIILSTIRGFFVLDLNLNLVSFMGFQVLSCWVLGSWIYGSIVRFFCLTFNLNEFEIRVSSIKVLDFSTYSVCFHNYVFKVSNL